MVIPYFLHELRIFLEKYHIISRSYSYGFRFGFMPDGNSIAIRTRTWQYDPVYRQEYLLTPEVLNNEDIVPYWSKTFDIEEFSSTNMEKYQSQFSHSR